MESFGPDRTLLPLLLAAAGRKSATKIGDKASARIIAEMLMGTAADSATG